MTTGERIEIVTANRQAFSRRVDTLSNQANVAAQFTTGRVDHSLAAGVELIREEGRTLRDWTGLGTAADLTKTVNVTAAGAPIAPTVVAGTSPYQPNPARPIVGFAPVYRFVDDIRIDTTAVYAFDTVRFSERWQATGGARLERYEASYAVRDTTTGTVAPFEVSDTLLTGKVGVVYKPVRAGSLYASWGVAAQPPGTNNLSNDNGSRSNGTPGTTGQNSPSAKPVESFNSELGLKWSFLQRRLDTSIALFRSERTNISVATDTNGVPTLYGDQTVQGVEFGVTGRITPDWAVFGGYSWLDSENRNPNNANQDGSELNWTPTYSGNLWTTYRLPVGLTVGGGVQVSGPSRVSLNQTSAAKLPGTSVVNLMAAYAVNQQLTLRLNVTNVGDRHYARSLNNNSNRAYFGDPRAFRLTADYRF
jgi:catecholate siderophore receptor